MITIYYNNLLDKYNISDKNKQIIKASNYNISVIYDILKISNKIQFILKFIFINTYRNYYNTPDSELIYYTEFNNNLDYILENLPEDAYKHLNIKYFYNRRFFLSYTNCNNKNLFEKMNLVYLKMLNNSKIKTLLDSNEYFFKDVKYHIKYNNYPYKNRNKIKIGFISNKFSDFY